MDHWMSSAKVIKPRIRWKYHQVDYESLRSSFSYILDKVGNIYSRYQIYNFLVQLIWKEINLLFSGKQLEKPENDFQRALTSLLNAAYDYRPVSEGSQVLEVFV